MKIVVIGGTGLIGSKTVAQLQQRGHEAVAAAPNTGVNTITGDGLADALAGAAVVIDVSNSPSLGEKEAMDFFGTSARNIAAAERSAGVKHHVALSVVGTDRLQDSGYFRAKLAQERMIAEAGIPFSLVHATQFFEFIRSIAIRERSSPIRRRLISVSRSTIGRCSRGRARGWAPRGSTGGSSTSRRLRIPPPTPGNSPIPRRLACFARGAHMTSHQTMQSTKWLAYMEGQRLTR